MELRLDVFLFFFFFFLFPDPQQPRPHSISAGLCLEPWRGLPCCPSGGRKQTGVLLGFQFELLDSFSFSDFP